MPHPLRDVKALESYVLLATFQDGSICRYDTGPLLRRTSALWVLHEIPNLFDLVRVDAGGHGVIWQEGICLSSDEIWANGTPADDLSEA